MSLADDVNLLLTCAPAAPCPREEACFRVAKYLRDHLHSESPAPYATGEIRDDVVIADYAPNWEAHNGFVPCRDG
jgi:hypothetical protein